MLTKARARRLLARCSRRPVLVLGDLMLDRYVYGTVQRISPEAPVPVVCVTGERSQPGGAANVALNVQSLGGRAAACGVVGGDGEGAELVRMLRERGIATGGVMARRGGTTTVKTRVVAERQQVVRVDRERRTRLGGSALREFCALAAALARKSAAVIIEDYAKGAVTREVAAAVVAAARERGVPVGLDPNPHNHLAISGITLATPNYREACAAAGLAETPLRGDLARHRTLNRAAAMLLGMWDARYVMITLGAHGMFLASRDQAPLVLPTKAREVFDVSGAGDTVIATAMLGLAAGATYPEAAALANYAAGVVVGKLGTATCTPAEILASMEE